LLPEVNMVTILMMLEVWNYNVKRELTGPICHSIETRLLKLPDEKLFVLKWVSGHDNALFQSLGHVVIKSYRNVVVYLALSDCPHVTTFRITEFYAIWCWAVLSKFFSTFHFWFKLDGNSTHFTWRLSMQFLCAF